VDKTTNAAHTRPKPCATSRAGFTLIELLIVIGLLAALATIVLPSITSTRTEALDDSLVQKELSDIQRAFQRFVADCAPQQDDYKLFAVYGLAPLIRNNAADPWYFDEWDNERRKGWRGPYINVEGFVDINIAVDANGIPTAYGQQPLSGGTAVPVIETPYADDEDGFAGGYYRVIPEVDSGTIKQLWVVFPSHRGDLDVAALGCAATDGACIISNLEPYTRRLMLGN
jgi:prepilin-type N-terminal cleavage/methylation domain-containing protein